MRMEHISLPRYSPSLVGQQSSAKSAQAEFSEHSAGPTKTDVSEVLEVDCTSVGVNEGLSDGTNDGVSVGINDGTSDGMKGVSEGTNEGESVKVPSKQQSIRLKEGTD